MLITSRSVKPVRQDFIYFPPYVHLHHFFPGVRGALLPFVYFIISIYYNIMPQLLISYEIMMFVVLLLNHGISICEIY